MSRTPDRTESLLCSLGWHSVTPFPRYNNGFYFAQCRRCGCDLVRTTYAGWHVPAGHRVIWQREAPGRALQPELAADDVSAMIGQLEEREAAELIAARLADRQAPPPAPSPTPDPMPPAVAMPVAASVAGIAAASAVDPGEAQSATGSDGPGTPPDAAPSPAADLESPGETDGEATAPEPAAEPTVAILPVDVAEPAKDAAPDQPAADSNEAAPLPADAAPETDASVTDDGVTAPSDASADVADAAMDASPPTADHMVDSAEQGTILPDGAPPPVSTEESAESVPADDDPAAPVGTQDLGEATTETPSPAPSADGETIAASDEVPATAGPAELSAPDGDRTAAAGDTAGEDGEDGEDGPKSLVPDFMDNPWPIDRITEIAAQRPREPDVTLMTMSGPPVFDPTPAAGPGLAPPPPDGAASSAASASIAASSSGIAAPLTPTMPDVPAPASRAATPPTPPASMEKLGLPSLDRLANNVERTDDRFRTATARDGHGRKGGGKAWPIMAVAAAIAVVAVGGWALTDDTPPAPDEAVLVEGAVGGIDTDPAAGNATAMVDAASAGIAFIDARRLNCRAQPTRSAASLAVLERGRRVRVTEERGEWSGLAVVGGSVCWTQSRFLSDTPRA